MPGPSLSPDQLPNFVADHGNRLLSDAYEPATEAWRDIVSAASIRRPTDLHDAPNGERRLTLVGVGRPQKYHDGEEVRAQTVGEGWEMQLGAPQFADKIVIPYSIFEGNDPGQAVLRQLRSTLPGYARSASTEKDRLIAGMFQKGTLAAGSQEYFDNSYPGAPQTSPKFIYDGKPWFAASGNGHPLKYGTATPYNLIASSALTAANLDEVYKTMSTTNAVDERGIEITVTPRVLMVGPGLRTTAMQLLESQNLPGSANNDINPNRGLLRMVVNRYLTDDTDAWWMLGDDAGLDVVDSGLPEVVTYDEPGRRCWVVQAHYRFGAAVKDWRYAFAANKATT